MPKFPFDAQRIVKCTLAGKIVLRRSEPSLTQARPTLAAAWSGQTKPACLGGEPAEGHFQQIELLRQVGRIFSPFLGSTVGFALSAGKTAPPSPKALHREPMIFLGKVRKKMVPLT